MNKKSLSPIITTVLLLAITFSLSVIIFNFSKNFIQEVEMSPSVCYNLREKIEVSAFHDENKNETRIILRKLTEKEIEKIDFILNFETSKSTWTCSNECGNCKPQQSFSKTYYITSAKPGKVEIKINDCPVGSYKVIKNQTYK